MRTVTEEIWNWLGLSAVAASVTNSAHFDKLCVDYWSGLISSSAFFRPLTNQVEWIYSTILLVS